MFYLVAIPQNKPLEILRQMKERGLNGEVSTSFLCSRLFLTDDLDTAFRLR